MDWLISSATVRYNLVELWKSKLLVTASDPGVDIFLNPILISFLDQILLPFPNPPPHYGQLMGCIGQFGARELNGWFEIGTGGEFVARSQGVLEFAVNDNKPGDNAGSFRIEVTIEPAK